MGTGLVHVDPGFAWRDIGHKAYALCQHQEPVNHSAWLGRKAVSRLIDAHDTALLIVSKASQRHLWKLWLLLVGQIGPHMLTAFAFHQVLPHTLVSTRERDL